MDWVTDCIGLQSREISDSIVASNAISSGTMAFAYILKKKFHSDTAWMLPMEQMLCHKAGRYIAQKAVQDTNCSIHKHALMEDD